MRWANTKIFGLGQHGTAHRVNIFQTKVKFKFYRNLGNRHGGLCVSDLFQGSPEKRMFSLPIFARINSL